MSTTLESMELRDKLMKLIYEFRNTRPANLVDELERLVNERTALARQEGEKAKITGETSDGYHTFNELYEFRKLYNAALFNEWYRLGKYDVHKSKRHHDNQECFGGGWFIVMATTPYGQISNHYELKDWDLFKCVVKDRADEWDGHTPQDVISTLTKINKNAF